MKCACEMLEVGCTAWFGRHVKVPGKRKTMSKTSKTEGSVFEIRPGVFAYGAPGQKAVAVVERFKGGGEWSGVRGVKPIIGLGAKQGNAPAAALEKLAGLGA